MKLHAQKSRGGAIGVAALVLCAFAAMRTRPVAASESAETIELTQTDLFSLPDWQNENVSVGGFIPGMTRSQALQLAQSRGWVLRPNTPTKTVGELKGPCTQASCGIYIAHGNWIGLDLYFDAADRIRSVKVSFPADLDPEVERVSITRKSKGLTRKCFTHYSDDLRNRVLGRVEGKTRESIRSAPFEYVEYDYPNLRLIVHTTINTKDNPVKPFDLKVDFMAHH